MALSSIPRFLAFTSSRARGSAAESAAHRWLRRRGFEIVKVNFRTKSGEIDIIAIEGRDLCFIEVKARSSRRFGTPLDAVPKWKQRRIGRAAATFLSANDWPGPCRFDVLGIERSAGGWSFQLVRNAFWL